MDPRRSRASSGASGSSESAQQSMELDVDPHLVAGGRGSPGGSGNNGGGNGGRAGSPGQRHSSGDEATGGNGSGDEGGNGNGGNGNGGDVSAPQRSRIRSFDFESYDIVRSRPETLASKMGIHGTAINLVANYFVLEKKKGWRMNLCRVEFEPELDSIKIRKKLLRKHEAVLGQYVFDGQTLFLLDDLTDEKKVLRSTFEDTNVEYRIDIRFLREMTTAEPLSFQFYNIILRKCQQSLNLELMGRHYYDPAGKVEIRNHRLELWPGFITSMRQQEREMMLNVETTHKVIHTSNVFNKMTEVREKAPRDRMREEVEKAIVGLIVMTRYNKKTYKIAGIGWDVKPTSTFPTKNGETSYLQYYETRYGVKINVTGQPLLLAKPSKKDFHRGQTGPIYLIPELCHETGLTEAMRSNFKLMKDLSEHLHMKPDKRAAATQKLIDRLLEKDDIRKELESWKMRFNRNLVPVPGRVLTTEKIVFGGPGSDNMNKDGDWTNAFRSCKMFSAVEIKKWAVIVPQREDANVGNLISTIQRVATPIGMRLSRPEIFTLQGINPHAYRQKLDEVMNKLGKQIDLVFIILPNNNLATYAAVKKRCSIDFGVPSQCFLARNVTAKGLMSIATKVAIQINAKLGGEPWSVVNPLQNLMVVGFDAYHGGGKSIGAMTATISHSLAKYFSTVTRYDAFQEVSTKMGAEFRKCLTMYQNVNKKLPDRIMFYRDGVGDGQLTHVSQVEIAALESVMMALYKEHGQPLPRFSFIVITKRINTRLFHQQRFLQNPPPGTIVDDVITCPERYDFFLIPQNVRQGTVSPINCNVLKDNSGLDPDKMQRFTFKMCHLYFNWSGTVAVPAPCQYAHKLAFLTGQALEGPANPNLQNLLHYL